MNSVSINIKSFGAIRNSSVDLKPFMVFSGSSGLGKSYVSFLIHYVYVLLTTDRLKKFFEHEDLLSDSVPQISTLRNWSISSERFLQWINRDAVTYVGYLIGNENLEGEIEFHLPQMPKEIIFSLSEELGGLQNDEMPLYKLTLDRYSYNILSEAFKLDYTPFVVLLRAYLQNLIFGDFKLMSRSVLMPPARGGLLDLLERPRCKSGMYEEFFDFKTWLQMPVKNGVSSNANFKECLHEINNGAIRQEGETLLYEMSNGQVMPLSAAASSIKEAAPLSILFSKFPPAGLSVMLEEPEAHLHPEKQVQMAQLIALSVNNGCHMQITTHSDYLLGRINILMALNRLMQFKKDETSKLLDDFHISKDMLIDPKMVGAYYLEATDDGYSKIIKQSLDDYRIPYNTFYSTMEEDIEISDRISNLS